MSSDKLELFAKVIAWRVIAMTCGFLITYAFTGEAVESAGASVTLGIAMIFVQWIFEMTWEKHVRERLRSAITRKSS